MHPKASSIRVRFAPSPTGHLHVGGARTAFFNWLFAKHMNATSVLRIEDTDQARSTLEHEQMICNDLLALGLDFDETPAKPGAYGPYRQSERLAIYAQHAQLLVDKDLAYPCFCSEAELSQKREAALKMGKTPHYDGTCLKLTPQEREAKKQAGGFSLRFKAPQKNYVLQDAVRGSVEFKAGMVGDFLITRTAKENEQKTTYGFPVYNFCCVIDDGLMQISHVIRAEEHLSNTVRQLMLYEALNWTAPQFAHISLILGSDRQKLSKRSGDVSAIDYLEKGFLPEVLLNFLILLGWSPKNGMQTQSGHPEIFTLPEMTHHFNLAGLQKAGAVFDQQKLEWMNSYYINHMSLEDLSMKVAPFFKLQGQGIEKDQFVQLLELLRPECVLLTDFAKKATPFLKDFHPLHAFEAQGQLLSPEQRDHFKTIGTCLSTVLRDFSDALTLMDAEAIVKKCASLSGLKGKMFFQPLRLILSGQDHGPELKLVVRLLGKAECLRRCRLVTD
jgi:nondiscriminating glutamyl-tRNA synthetase